MSEREITQDIGGVALDVSAVLLEHASDGVWIWDVEEDVVRWSDRLFALLGHKPGSLEPTFGLVQELVHPEDRARFEEAIEDHLAHGGHYQITMRMRRANGRYVWVEARGGTTRAETGEVRQMAGTVQDVTERMANEALRDAQCSVLERVATGATLSDALDSICRSIEMLVPGSVCSVMMLDEKTETISLVSAPSVPEEIRAMLTGIDPGRHNGSCAAAIVTGEPVYVEDTKVAPSWRDIRDVIELTGIRACWSEPIFADSDRAIGSFAICHSEPKAPGSDHIAHVRAASQLAGIAVTRHRMERRLLRGRSVLDTVSEMAPSLIFRCAPNGDPTYMNRRWAEFTGRDQESWRDGGWMKAVHSKDLQRVLTSWRHSVSQRETFREEYRFVHPDDEEIWVLAEANPVYTDTGEHEGFVGIATNITDRHRSEERTRLLMAELNHRVKNTLASVLGLCDQTVRSSETTGEFQRKFTGRIHSLARIHDMLSATKWAGVELHRVIAQIVEPCCDMPKARLHVEGAELIVPVGAATAMSLAIHEMTTNAVKHGVLSVHGGALTITWEMDDDRWLTLHWTERGGPSVDPGARPGMGLGLMRGLIEHELHGSMEIEMNREGVEYRLRASMGVDQAERTPRVAESA